MNFLEGSTSDSFNYNEDTKQLRIASIWVAGSDSDSDTSSDSDNDDFSSFINRVAYEEDLPILTDQQKE